MSSANTISTDAWDSPDVSVLRDVLDQLDRERAKRAELEAKIKFLSDELAREKAKSISYTIWQSEASRAAFLSMEAQVTGFKQMVDALTEGNPAISAASKILNQTSHQKHSRSLPLHIIRLLEVIPWDTRLQEIIFGHEDVFEWQIFDTRENRWQSSLRFFPNQFKTLPVSKVPSGQSLDTLKDRSFLLYLAHGETHSSKPSKFGVLTDESISKMYRIEQGFPLPDDGGVWEWIGGWRVDKKVTPSVNCDINGWSYVVQPNHFLEEHLGNVFDSQQNESASNFRRRKWTRRRVLVDYPLASERTRQYLKLLAENARLSLTAGKLSDQLGDAKTLLTQTEVELSETKALFEKQIIALEEINVNVKGDVKETKSDGVKKTLKDFFPRR